MLDKIAALPKLRSTGGASGRIARLEERVDLLTRLLGGLYGGAGIDIQAEGEDRIRVDCTAAGGGMAGRGNSAFVATVTPHPTGSQNPSCYVVNMLGGTVQGIFGHITLIEDTEWDSSERIQDGEIFWLQYDPSEEEWTVEHGETLPTSATTMDDQSNYFAVIPLFRVDAAVDDLVVQYHYGSVYVPTVGNVVDVQEHASGEGEGGEGGTGGEGGEGEGGDGGESGGEGGESGEGGGSGA